jgi:hypothetical protein
MVGQLELAHIELELEHIELELGHMGQGLGHTNHKMVCMASHRFRFVDSIPSWLDT